MIPSTVKTEPKRKPARFPILPLLLAMVLLSGLVAVSAFFRGRGQQADRQPSPLAQSMPVLLGREAAPLSPEEEALRQRYESAQALLARGETEAAAKAFYQAKGYLDAWERCAETWGKLIDRRSIAAGSYHAVGLREDGTVLAAGDYTFGQCAVLPWTEVTALAAGSFHTLGLREDGTVLAVGRNDDGQCDVSGWTDMVAVAAKGVTTLGLKADGTVLTTDKTQNKPEALDWHTFTIGSVGQAADGLDDPENLVSVGGDITGRLGLRKDGTVVTSKGIRYGMADAAKWDSIVDIGVGSFFVIGLRADGTVLAAGSNERGQCDTAAWRDIRLPAFAADMQLSGKLAAAETQATAPVPPEVEPIYSEAYLRAKDETLETWRDFLRMVHQNSPELPQWDPYSTEDYLPGIPQYTANGQISSMTSALDVSYWTCDFDGNGFEELVIGDFAVYCFDGASMRYAFQAMPLGYRCRLWRCEPETKSFFVYGSGGASNGTVGIFQFAQDGFSVSPVRLYHLQSSPERTIENVIGTTSLEQSSRDTDYMFEDTTKPWYTFLGLEPELLPVLEQPAAYCAARDALLASWRTFARMLRDGSIEPEALRSGGGAELPAGISASQAEEILASEQRGLLYVETDRDRDGLDELLILCGDSFEYRPIAAYRFDGQQMEAAALPEEGFGTQWAVFIAADA